MDTCSSEVVALIFEHACFDDLGRTARALGLVSKFFRSIAEPIELRAIAVAGFEQLEGVCARLKTVQTTDNARTPKVAVRHLFISELTKEHALAVDTDFGTDDYAAPPFWTTQEGKKLQASYLARADDFWKLAAYLVKSTSPTLQTLCLLASDNLWRAASCGRIGPKVLGTLSGRTFPELRFLTVNHNARLELEYLDKHGLTFQLPDVPSLRMLCIASWIFADKFDRSREDRKLVHPLLCLRHEASELSDLAISEEFLDCHSVEELMEAIFGAEWQALLAGGSFPGKLRSVVFHLGVEYCTCGSLDHEFKHEDFVDAIRRLNIDGIVGKFPIPIYAKEGCREYELLFDAWKEQYLAYSVRKIGDGNEEDDGDSNSSYSYSSASQT